MKFIQDGTYSTKCDRSMNTKKLKKVLFNAEIIEKFINLGTLNAKNILNPKLYEELLAVTKQQNLCGRGHCLYTCMVGLPCLFVCITNDSTDANYPAGTLILERSRSNCGDMHKSNEACLDLDKSLETLLDHSKLETWIATIREHSVINL